MTHYYIRTNFGNQDYWLKGFLEATGEPELTIKQEEAVFFKDIAIAAVALKNLKDDRAFIYGVKV